MRLLLVEDDPRMSRFIAKGLREHAYAVDIAIDGKEALYQVAINSYDAIILDIMIPIYDGFDVCQKLRKDGLSIPILMLTARDAVQDRIHGLDMGADDYLTKPFEFGELLARLRALFRRNNKLRSTKITIADLIIDQHSQRVWRNGIEICLTTKEYSLIEFLADNVGRVVGRAEIAEHVWDENFDPFSKLIEVYINRLRRKIDQNAKVPLLHTRRGTGYVLQDLSDETILE